MLLLAVDTSGKNGSLALALTNSQPEVDIIEVVPLAGGTFSAQLVPQVAALLAKHGYSKSHVTAFAAVSGPGSFTGLRVGLAAIKALAEVLQKPVAAVSLLEAIACSGHTNGRFLAILDAGRNEVYVGDYEVTHDQLGARAKVCSERLLSREEFLKDVKSRAVITPDATLAEILRSAGAQCERIDPVTAAAIARLGWQHILRGQIVRSEDLEANYIRRSDAEIFSKQNS
jgi:tRNA threonylcarbamoyladenosine biosynthesis protein TsaB